MNKLIIWSLVFMSVQLSAQSGFDFKRKNTIGYSNTVLHMLDVLKVSANKHNFTYQRVLNRRSSLIVNYSVAHCPMHYYFSIAPNLTYNRKDNNGTQTINNIIAKDGNSFYNTSGFSIGIRKFIHSKGSVAPYGSFLEIKLGHEKATRAKSPPLEFYSADQKINYTFPNKGITSVKFVNVQLGGGSSHPITPRLTFTWLLNFTVNIPTWYDYHSIYVYNEDEYFFRNASVLHQTNNFINLNLGVSYSF